MQANKSKLIIPRLALACPASKYPICVQSARRTPGRLTGQSRLALNSSVLVIVPNPVLVIDTGFGTTATSLGISSKLHTFRLASMAFPQRGI